MKTTRHTLAAVAAMSLSVVAAAHAEWTDQDTRDCWDWAKSSATRIVTSPRYSGADEEAGEGMLEAFGTEYMPNAYDIYQKARATAKERELSLKENFPKGIQSDSTGGSTYRKVAKATAKAICEMNRRHDELCHFYLMHKGGVMTSAELAEKDQKAILMMLPFSESFEEYNVSVKQLSEIERTFAGQHLPDVLASYDSLSALLHEGRDSFAALRKDAICLDAICSAFLIRIYLNRLRGIGSELDKIVDVVKQNKLLYEVEDMSADDLAKLNQETALKLKERIKYYEVRGYVQRNWESWSSYESGMVWHLPPAKQIIRQLVQIPEKHYRVCKYEVTQGQWQGIMGSNPSEFKGDTLPVEKVSWDDCQKFVETLNALEEVKTSGLVFRLPTKKEWNYVCRAGATGDYCKLADGTEVTEDSLGSVAWLFSNSKIEYSDRGWTGTRRQTHAVGSKKPNAFGLYDMFGNVAEWTSTPVSYNDNRYFVLGGNYNSNGVRDMSEYVSGKDVNLGFRIVAETVDDLSAMKRESVAASNARIEAVKPILGEMGITTKVVELPGGSQLLMNELPRKGYWMGAFEVTQAQWEAIMGNNPSENKGADLPVEHVSLSDCNMFIEKLNALDEVKKSGLVVHLPTALELQNARRAGLEVEVVNGRKREKRGGFLFADGTTVEDFGDVAWTRENSVNHTHPVGQKKPNAYGLYDVLGNVREWVADDVGDGYLRALGGGYSDGVNLEGPDSSATRSREPDADLGFRIAAKEPKVAEATETAEAAAAAEAEAARVAALNSRITAAMPTLKAMGIETTIIELPEGAQLLMNKLPNGQWVGAFEVTETQWKSVMGRRAKGKENSDRPMTILDSNPENSIQRFIEELNSLDKVKQSGMVFYIPTTEEWDYACRAGAKGEYCLIENGVEITRATLEAVAWLIGNSGQKLQSVGMKKPNAFGLYDMFGNAWELTSAEERKWGLRGGSCNASIDTIGIGEFRLENVFDRYAGFRLAAEKCDRWEEIEGGTWVRLLISLPKLAEKCNKWNDISVDDSYPDSSWPALLARRPQFADKCGKWSEFSGHGWAKLLCSQTRFADMCDWSKLDGADWALLLEKQPQFADKCDWSKLEKLDKDALRKLTTIQPQFGDKLPQAYDNYDKRGKRWR